LINIGYWLVVIGLSLDPSMRQLASPTQLNGTGIVIPFMCTPINH
jgi:hypothetical protein